MLSLYLRKESRERKINGKLYNFPIVVAYSDKDATTMKGLWGIQIEKKPDRRNKYIVLNCFKWRVIWLNDRRDIKK